MFIIISDRQKATSRANQNLCVTCCDYRAVTYALDDQQERLCMNQPERPMRLRGPVSCCTDYVDKTKPRKWEMDKMAWAIEPTRQIKGFGAESTVKFVPPSERKDIEK
jgi:hypothetical protein